MRAMPDDDYIGGMEESAMPTGNEQIIVAPSVAGEMPNTKTILIVAGVIAALWFLSKKR